MPSYYEGTIEPIEYMSATFTDEEYRGFLKGNIIKYISRAGKKGHAIEDLKKAGVYLEWLIELETPDESDMAYKTLEQIMKESEEDSLKKRQEAWIRLRDARGWT